MRNISAALLAFMLLSSHLPAATEGSDFANDPAYDDGWTSGDDGGTPATFGPWTFVNNNNGTTVFAGNFIGSSTSGGGGDINTGGESFGMYANPGSAFADADRSFDSALAPGQTFSFDLAVNFTNGNKGFSLFSGATQIFNFNVSGGGTAQYSINGTNTGLTYEATSVFHFEFTQTGLGTGTYSVSRGAFNATDTYTGDPTNFRFYINGTDNGDPANNLYFNNLVVIPEPTTGALLLGALLLGGAMLKRRS